MSSNPRVNGDHYDTLGLKRDAATEDVKKAFRKLARECHPDVAKDDADAADRFNRIRAAYEVLVDPVERARYDRSLDRAAGGGRSGGWRPPGGPFGFGGTRPTEPGASRPGSSRNASGLDLEDIFGDFGGMSDFGFGNPGAARGPGRRGSAPPPPAEPRPGRDISLQVDVPIRTANLGGTVTLHYPRLRRGDDGVALYRYNEIYDLRVPPGTRHGDTVRIERMGDAGTGGGIYGDLVCDLRVVGDGHGRTVDSEPPPPPPPRAEAPPPDAGPGANDEVQPLPISVVEALLGGRVEVDTPTGRVRVSIPPCTSSGSRLRLRGKGRDGGDLYVEVRIYVPKVLDDESRRLIERFAQLNPDIPRE